MIKKDAVYKWDKRGKDTFTHIKEAIAEASTLYSLDFNQDLLLYTFASDTYIVVMLTQKEELNNERTISFMSMILQGPKVRYPIMEKQAYVVKRVVKYFKPYLLKNHCIICVPHPAVRSLFVQQVLGERRVN